MLIITIGGWIGMALILISYLLITTKQISPSSFIYQIINFIGAAGIVLDSVINGAWPSAVFFVIWGCMALISLIIQIINSKKEKKEEEKIKSETRKRKKFK
jgi:uncharacterized membrane protein YcaP (DUF421 family)